MKNLKLAVCLGFAGIFSAVTLFHSNPVTGQIGGSALSAPTGVRASDSVYNNRILVEWDTIRGATSYRVFRNTVNNPATAIEIAITQANSFRDVATQNNQIPANQAIFYWVRAENGSTVSQMSLVDQGMRTGTQGGGPQLNPPPANPGNPTTATKVYLGKALFWDEQMSSTRTVACGTCHHSGNGGTDPRSVAAGGAAFNPGFDGVLNTADDVRGSQGVPSNNLDGSYVNVLNYGLNAQVTGRKTVSYVNAGYPGLLFWDGRATGDLVDPITNTTVIFGNSALESQVLGPPVSSAEMGHTGRDWNDVASRIASSQPLALAPTIPAALKTWINGRSYPELFLEAFGTAEVTPTRIAMAIGAFERTLYTDQAPVDLDAAGISTLSAAAVRGRDLFNRVGPGPGNTDCAACHAGPTFSDNQFHNIGVRPPAEDLGRAAITGNPAHNGQFRTPDLRNVDLRKSFFHNGRFTTLEEVVAFYNRGGDVRGPGNPTLDNRIRPLGLNPGQQADLVAFLHALTDQRLVNEQAPFDRPGLYTESNRVPVLTGNGIAGSGNIVPQIQAISPPVLGNPNFTVSLSNALGNAEATLVIATRDYTAIPPKKSRSFLFIRTVNTMNTGAGNGWTSVSFPISTARPTDVTYYARWFIKDPSAPGGYATTPAMSFTLFAPTSTSSFTENEFTFSKLGEEGARVEFER